MSITVGINGVTFPDGSSQNTATQYGMKNRIINGAMVIDQRNAGASVTPTTLYSTYTLDRWNTVYSTASKFSVQQNAGSVTPPANFTNYLGITSLSSYSVPSNEQYTLLQYIEGYNIADLGWGTASAKTVTLSAWVRSSLTGTFSGVLSNSNSSRCYPFTYSISVANTWTQISVTVPGDTTGTWLTTNGLGMQVLFSMGNGSGYQGAAGAWSGNAYTGAIGQTNLVATTGATFYITGVQLEKGSTATEFERRPYGLELSLCQRYYQSLPFQAGFISLGSAITTGAVRGTLIKLDQIMRVNPTITLPTTGTGTGQIIFLNANASNPAIIGGIQALRATVDSFQIEADAFTSAFTPGQAVTLYAQSGGITMTANAEL